MFLSKVRSKLAEFLYIVRAIFSVLVFAGVKSAQFQANA